VTARALAAGVDPADEQAVAHIARGLDLDFTTEGLTVDGVLVGLEIRTPAVDRSVSQVSAHPAVRDALVEHQRRIMSAHAIVAEGRDIGTVVYPGAPVKIFLTASIGERARRRHRDLAGAGHEVALEDLAAEIERRDSLDSSRAVSPLVAASDAIHLDTTDMTVDEVVGEIAAIARRVGAGA
jgi:cytidylate kinase